MTQCPGWRWLAFWDRNVLYFDFEAQNVTTPPFRRRLKMFREGEGEINGAGWRSQVWPVYVSISCNLYNIRHKAIKGQVIIVQQVALCDLVTCNMLEDRDAH